MRVLDLFSGIGGFSLGLERTGGFETAAFCEIDEKARKVLRRHWPDVPIFTDVSTLTAEAVHGTVGAIDVVTGGFPCQDISLAGKGAGLSGVRSGLWFHMHRIIKEVRPRYAIIENVSALRSRGLDVVLRGLAALGYDAEWHCIPASAVGAPHRRDRVWIMAYPQHAAGWSVDTSGCGVGREDDGIFQRQEITGRLAISGSDVADAENEWLDLGNWKQADHAGKSRLRGAELGRGVGNERTPSYAAGDLRQLYLSGEFEPKYVAYTNNTRLEGLGLRIGSSGEEVATSAGSGGIVRRIDRSLQWKIEPDVGRVAHGLPNRVDRLKQLGNAVVPQIVQIIGESILAYDRWQKEVER